jgi:hypothetical protein
MVHLAPRRDHNQTNEDAGRAFILVSTNGALIVRVLLRLPGSPIECGFTKVAVLLTDAAFCFRALT